MQKSIVLFLLIVGSQAMYSDDDVFYCDEPFTDDELSDLIQIQPVDRFIFLIGSPLAFCCTIFITFTFFKYPNTRKMPSDIVFFISLSDCILCIHWFATALYFTIYQDSPLSGGAFCQVNSIFSIFAGTGEVAYNIVFCLYLRLTFKNQFRVIPKLPRILHSLAWFFMIFVPLLAYLTDQNGLSLFGTCSFKYHPGFPVAGILLVFSYTLISCYTIVYFKKTIPDDEKYKEQKENFTKYYYRYIVASCIIWSTEAVCFTLAGFNCQYFHKGFLLGFLTIGNAAKLCTPIVLSILRYNDPTIKKQVKKVFKKFFTQRPKVHAESLESLIDTNYFDNVNLDLQQDQVFTIISGIRFICREQEDNLSSLIETNEIGVFNIQRRETENKIRTDSIFGSDITRMSQIFNFAPEDINEEITYKLDENSNKQHNLSLKLTASTIIVYSPKIFQKIREKDAQMINLLDSFDPEANYQQIKEFKGVDGGKGGAFFFFTFDNKLMIKTLNDEELLAFRKRLVPYFLHMQENETVISPIYGLYKFQRENANESTNVVVMRNAIQIPSCFQIRTYDIKGSAFQREVLMTSKSSLNLELTKITLKDMDFKKLEKNKINIPENLKYRLSNCLIRDAQFFSKVGFMDYSLLLLKVDWLSYLGQNFNEKTVLGRFTSELYCMPSTLENEKGVFYHFAIIDYLQEWNAQKKIEKTTKKALNANIKLDTSAQNPEDYANRFIEKVAKTIIQN